MVPWGRGAPLGAWMMMMRRTFWLSGGVENLSLQGESQNGRGRKAPLELI